MSDIYKLQYNGMTLAYPGWNGYVSWENAEVAYNLYLQQQTGGTITADKLSGMNGEIVTLSNTPDIGYQFNSYGITGAELSGNQFAFDGSDVTAQANFDEAVYTLTLQNDGHGTIAATKTTGHAGDTVTLSNTYNTYYRFNNYTVTGGTINESTFTFGSQDATAKANFKVNAFTATGGWEKGSNVDCDGVKNAATADVPAKYAVHGAHTGEVPASWYSTSNRWKPSNASAYAIRVSTNVSFSGEGVHAYNSSWPSNGVTAKLVAGSTQLNQTTKAAFNGAWAYSTTQTSNVQNNVYISAHLYAEGISTYFKNYHGIVRYVANNNSSTWSATGYAP